MGFNVNIKVNNVQDLKALASVIRTLIQQATGKVPHINIQNRRMDIMNNQKRIENTNRKLLK